MTDRLALCTAMCNATHSHTYHQINHRNDTSYNNNKRTCQVLTVVERRIEGVEVDGVLDQDGSDRGGRRVTALGNQVQRVSLALGQLVDIYASKKLHIENNEREIFDYILQATQQEEQQQALCFTRLRTIISEPASTVKCRALLAMLSRTREFMFTLTLMSISTVSMSERVTAMCKKLRPLLSH